MMRKRLRRIMIVVLAILLGGSGLFVPNASVSAASDVPSNLTQNPSFELDNAASVAPSNWNVIKSGGTVATQNGGTDGSYSARLTSVTRSGNFDNPGVGIFQRFTNLEQGTYTLTARIRSNNPNPSSVSNQEGAFMEAKNTGAPAMRAFLNLFAENTTDWNLVTLRNVVVYNGEATIGFYLKDAAAGMTIEVDDVQFYMEHSDQNPLQNWGFETGNAALWQTSGNVSVVTGHADSGTYAARLEAGSKVAQTVSVKPNTDYIVAARSKVSSGSNRLRLGVDGIQEARSAPSATTEYTLLPLSFRTGPNETSATIYVEQTAEGGGIGYADSMDLFEMNNDIVKGVDVSFLAIVEDYGGKYKANGVEQDFFDIIRNRGVNAVASMFFVESGNYIYEESEWKDYQAGLREDLPKQTYDMTYVNDLAHLGTAKIPLQMWPGYFGKEQALEIGQRARAHHMKFELSLHYSDTWMSSGKAWKPLSWFGQDLQQLQTTMYNYTYDLIKSLEDAGVAPDSVKLGNEQNSGIVWPDGKVWSTGRDGFAKLVNASYQAMKDASPTTRGFIHLNNGYLVDYTNQWFGVNENIGMKWDGEAYSLYGGRPTGAIVDMLNNNLTKWKGNDVVFSETGLMHTSENFDPAGNGSGMKNKYYEVSQRGQYNWLIEYMQAFRDVPNPHGAQLGFFYWAAEWISKGNGHDEWYSPWLPGGSTSEYGNTVDSRTLFTYDGHASDGLYAYLWRGKAISKPLGGEVSHNSVAESYEVVPTEAQSLSVPSGTLELRERESRQIVPTVQPINQFVYTKMKWETSNSSVAKVNEKGIVTAVTPGTATITVTLGELTTSQEVVVKAAKLAESVTFTSPNVTSGSMEAIVGDRIRITTNLSEADNRNVVFTSSDPSVASFLGEAVETSTPGELIQQTNITPDVTLLVKKDGVSTITVTSADGNATSSFQLNAKKIAIDAIHINEENFELEMNRTKQLAAIIDPVNASFQDVVWESSNNLVATVSKTGFVTAVGKGQSDITVRAIDGELSDSVEVTVVDVTTKSIKLDHELIRLRAGENTMVQATVLPVDTTNPAVQWISSDTGVFKVDNGVITAVADGSATLTVSAVDGGAETTINVVIADQIPVESVAIDQSALSLTAGLTAALSAVIQPASADNKQVSWSSSDESVATVDASGLVIAKGRGEATITVTAADGDLTGSSVVTVNDELQTHYVSAGSNRHRAANAAALALDNNAATAWSPGGYRQNNSDTWWMDLGQLAEIQTIDMSFWATQRYIIQVSEASTSDYVQATGFTTVADQSTQLSAGLTVAHTLPTGTKARWIRVQVFESYPSNNWLSIVDFKSHGRFLPQATKVDINASTATVIMGDSYQLQATVSPSYVPQVVQWTTSDATLATVDASGNVTTKPHNGEQGEIKPVTITATASNGVSSSTVIGVKSPIIVEAISIHRKDNQPLPGTGIVVNPEATIDLDVSIFQGEAAYRSVVWKSAQPEIASVDPSTGVVTAHQEGIAEISVEVDSYSNLPGGFVFIDQVNIIVQKEVEAPTFPAPTGLQTGTTTTDSINLSWNAAEEASGYNVYRSSEADGNYTKVNVEPVKGLTYTDSGLSEGTSYYYKLSAIYEAQESELTDYITASTKEEEKEEEETPTYSAPTGLQAGTTTTDSINLTWNAAEEASGYNVYRSSEADGNYAKVNVEPVTGLTYTDSGLSEGTAYYYKLSAIYEAQESELTGFVMAKTGIRTDSGGGNPVPAPNKDNSEVKDGTIKVQGKIGNDGALVVNLTPEAIKKALESSPSNQIMIEIKPDSSTEIKTTTVTFPLKELRDSGSIDRIIIHSGKLNIQIPINVVKAGEQSEQTEVKINHVQGEILSEKIKQRVKMDTIFDLSIKVDGQEIQAFEASKPITVDLEYDLKPGEKPHQLVVYQLLSNGELKAVKNTRYDQGVLSFRSEAGGRYAAAYVSVDFGDLNQSKWAQSMIEALAAREVLQGVGPGSFAPTRSITRAEFLELLLNALNLKQQNPVEKGFTDVSEDKWYFNTIMTAAGLGIVHGKSDGSFGAEEALSREDMAVMLAHAFEFLGMKVDSERTVSQLVDEDEISGYAKEAVSGLTEAGIINGFEDGSFRPKTQATRAQAAVLIYHMIY